MPWTAMLQTAVVVLLVAAMTLCVRSIRIKHLAPGTRRQALIGALTILIIYAVCPIAIWGMEKSTGWMLAAPVVAIAVCAMVWPGVTRKLLFGMAIVAPVVAFVGGLVLAFKDYEDAGFLGGLVAAGAAVVISAPCAGVATLLRTATASPREVVVAVAGWYQDITRPGTLRYWDGSAWTDQWRPAVAVPGWYQDITRSGTLRYWDGSAWTDQTKPVA